MGLMGIHMIVDSVVLYTRKASCSTCCPGGYRDPLDSALRHQLFAHGHANSEVVGVSLPIGYHILIFITIIKNKTLSTNSKLIQRRAM